MRFLASLTLASALAVASAGAAAADTLFSARLLGNIANQSIAGFTASTATWTIERGRVTLLSHGTDQAALIVRVRGLIIPVIDGNPSPDLLARLICHDEVGTPFEAARTRPVEFPASGDATFRQLIPRPGECFAPIVLLTGSRDPAGNEPGNWFAVSGL
jgi:hypothetical protein